MAELLGPAQIRELAARLEVTPTKKLGQNFVHDPNTVRKIVRLAGVTDEDHVIEVGPGLGSLTLGLTETGAAVTAVEIDERLALQLPTTAARMQPEAQLVVVQKDALELAARDLATAPTVLVANLPYNVSVPILLHLLAELPSLQHGLVMVQHEVGERIAADPHSKIYGTPSVKAAWYGTFTLAGNVSRNIFWPVPNVDSVLVSFHRHESALGSIDERDATFALVNAAFAQRRKMLRQSLRSGLPDHLAHAFATTEQAEQTIREAGVKPTARAEALTVHDFLMIARVAASGRNGVVSKIR